ncbi:hypothetical protein [Jiangella mangrovi]|uniref:Uncharacterized protein n=1 Tax=Jiangella mangrovi TaxID=1524084 RepID=A0A7W9LP47_9ACTN|nr:hypothetical protein [Jiangella mangrovi]MBB5790827.1 hypothetical protein [Jiangella mangrovi]
MKEPGPSAQRLLRRETPGIQALMAGAPEAWPPEVRAEAVLRLIYDLITDITNERWQRVAMAAFRNPPEDYVGQSFDSLHNRFRHLALQDLGSDGGDVEIHIERHRGYWSGAANQLATLLEERLVRMSQAPEEWVVYRREEHQPPPLLLPISFDRTDVLYQFDGLRGVKVYTYRWLTAHAAIDRYETVAWYYSDPDAPVEVEPLANCVIDGPSRELPQGGRTEALKFSHMLSADEQYFFAYAVHFNSDRPCRPSILYESRGRTIKHLIVRAQFDPRELPAKCWHVDMSAHVSASSEPPDDSPEVMSIPENGYLAHEWRYCQPGRKYGLLWTWRPPELAHD